MSHTDITHTYPHTTYPLIYHDKFSMDVLKCNKIYLNHTGTTVFCGRKTWILKQNITPSAFIIFMNLTCSLYVVAFC